MQRSRSSSCIPVPHAVTNKRLSKPSIGGRPRSTSSSRASGSKGLTPTVTPLSHRRLFSASSTPSHSSTKKTKCKIFNGVSPKKLWTDKKWVVHQYAKVRDFVIMNIGLFDGAIVNPDQLKPVPLKSFIHIVHVLLENIFAVVDPINQVNYKEVVTRYLKMLNCPVVPSMSTLKIVSSMHVFPQIITLLSWMVDFTDQVMPVTDETSIDRVPEDLVQAYLLQDATLRDFFLGYQARYQATSPVPYSGDQELQRLCDEILGVDDATLKKIEKEASDNEKLYQKQEEKFNSNHAEKLKLELEIAGMRDEILEFENEKTVLTETLSHLQPEINKIETAISDCEQSVKELKHIVKTQKMPFKDKQLILKEIEDLKNEVTRITENQKKINKIRDELDLQHSALQSQVQNEVDQWNISLLRTSPEYQKILKLREKGFHSLDFLQEINEVKGKKSALEDQVNKQIEDMKKKLYEVNKQYVLTKNNLDTASTSVTALEDSIKQLKVELAELENRKHKLSGDIKAQTLLHEANLKILKVAKDESKKNDKEIIDLKKTYFDLIEEKQNFMFKGTSFFVQYHTDIMRDVENMHVAIKQIRNNFINRLREQNDEMAEQIKFLEKHQS